MRFFLGQDNDSHWYIIPEQRRSEWEDWRNIDEEDERSWNEPPFAIRLGRHVSQLTFEDPYYTKD